MPDDQANDKPHVFFQAFHAPLAYPPINLTPPPGFMWLPCDDCAHEQSF